MAPFSIFPFSCGCAGLQAGADVEVAQKSQEGFVISDKWAIALDYGGEHIVVYQFSARAMKKTKSI